MNSNEAWCFVERERQVEIASELVRLGNQTGLLPCGVVIGEADELLARELGQYGIAKLYILESPTTDSLSPEDYAHLVTCLVKKCPPYVCLFAASPLGNEVAVRVAVRLGAGLITWCVDFNFVSGKLIATKKAYGGKACKRLVWQEPPPHLATVAPEVMEAITTEKPCSPVIQTERFSLPPSRVKLVGQSQLSWHEIPLTEATGVLGVGAGVENSAGMSIVEGLARLMNMPVGGTKRADEKGLISREHRIGASGISIESDIYIALGISGASHHMVGTRKVKHVVAVNKDKTAPIFDVAELGIVDDFRSVVSAVIEQLNHSNSSSNPWKGAI